MVAITDHNTAKWVDRVREAASSSLAVFPGVELTVSGGAHLLALFAPGTPTSEIDAFLGACDARIGEDQPARCSFIEAMAQAADRGAVVIAPHITTPKGLFQREGFSTTLQQVLSSDHLDAVEINDELSSVEEEDDQQKLLRCLRGEVDGYDRRRGPLPILTFSDAHELAAIGSRTTWIKMTQPTLEGLCLALQDGQPLSVRNPWQAGSENPNRHAEVAIEQIEIDELQYVGRGEPFVLAFNPWLNALVGGRGTGKSTVVESLRLALRRIDELPEALRNELNHFYRPSTGRDDRGLLTPQSEIRVIYRKGADRYRIRWRQDGQGPDIEAEDPEGDWQTSPGLVRERFPVRLYSQKQIFELARDPTSLLRIVDDAPEVRYQEWRSQWEAELNRFLQLRGRARALASRMDEEESLRGQMEDLRHKIAVFEQTGHAELLRAYQRRRRQRREVDRWLETLRTQGDRLREAAEMIESDPPDRDLWPSDDPTASVFEVFDRAESRVTQVRAELLEIAAQADRVAEDVEQELGDTTWPQAVEEATAGYSALVERLEGEGVSDPSEFGALVQRRQAVEERLRSLDAVRSELTDVEAEADQSLGRLTELRQEITQRRADFLATVLPTEGTLVQARVVPYGDTSSVEPSLRRMLGGTERHSRDIGTPEIDGGILGRLFDDYPPPGSGAVSSSLVQKMEGRLDREKQRLLRIFDGDDTVDVGDRRFASHVQSLSPESLDRLRAWFPEDSLQVSYSPQGDGTFRPIEQASPGQKTAALLTFLLAYGKEPIVLDQPEDDLDNHLIYSLLVQRLRAIKADRQVIVVTHNPNIVVHGDAELVVSLDQRGGCTRKIADGGLQEKQVRDEVCRVMEGGVDALRRRYQRIVGLEESRGGGR